MKAKQIKDLASAIANDSNVQDNTTARHTHDETTNVLPKSDGAGNYDDSQISDDGTTIMMGSGEADSTLLLAIKTALAKAIQVETTKTDGDTTALRLIADSVNSGKNVSLELASDGSTDENIALRVLSGKIVLGNSTSDDSALLQLDSTTQGFTVPRMTETERDAIVTPMKGLIIYSTTADDLQINIGDGATPNWVGLKAVGITGSGTTNTIPRFTGATTLADGSIKDDGTTLAVNTTLDGNSLMTFLSSLTHGIKMLINKASGTVYGIYSRAEGSSGHNIGLMGSSDNASENDGVVGVAGSSLVKPWRGYVGVRGVAYSGDNTKEGVGVMGYSNSSQSLMNVGVWGYGINGQFPFAGVFEGKMFVEDHMSGYDWSNHDPSAMAEFSSITRGLLIPRMTTAQKNAIVSPAKSLMVFDTDENDLQINIGDDVTPNWVGTGASGIQGTLTTDSVPRATGTNTIADGTINDDGSSVAIGSAPSGSLKFFTLVAGGESYLVAMRGLNGSTQAIDTIGVEGVSNGAKANKNTGVEGFADNSTVRNIGVSGVAVGSSNAVYTEKHVGGFFIADQGGLNEDVIGLMAQAVGDNTADNYGFEIYVENNGTGSAIIGRIINGSNNTGKFMSVINSNGHVDLVDITPESIVGDFPDSAFKIQGSSDQTKKMKFEVDGLTASTTRTITMVDRDITMIGSGGTNTQNKVAKYDANGDLIDSTINDDGTDVAIGGSVESSSRLRVYATGQNKSTVHKVQSGDTENAVIVLDHASTGGTGARNNVVVFKEDDTTLWIMGTNNSGGGSTDEFVIANGDSFDTNYQMRMNKTSGDVQFRNIIETGKQFKAPTDYGNTTTTNNFDFDCNVGMVQDLDLQGQTATGTLTISNPIEGNTYTMMVIQGSGTYGLTFPTGWWLNDNPPFDFTTLADNERVLCTMTYLNATWYFSAKKLSFHSPSA